MADWKRQDDCACNAASPARSCCARRPPARRARAPGCRRSSRACPRRPAPASPGVRSCRAPPAWRWRSTAPAGSAGTRSRRASPRRPSAPAEPVLVSVFMDGGVDSLSVLAPDRPSALRAAAAQPRRSAPARARRSPRTRQPALAPVGRVAGHAARRGQGHACSRPSATPTPTSRTSPAATSGRSARPTRRAAGLDGPLPRPPRHRPTTRSRACRWAGTWRRRWPSGSVPVAACPRPTTTTSGRPACGARSSDAMLSAIGTLGTGSTSDAGLRQARDAAAATGRLRAQLAAVPGRLLDARRA